MANLFDFNYKPAQAHSKTSIAGLKNVDESGRRETQVSRILVYLSNCGVDGASIREISNHFKMGMNIASARVRDIELAGEIIKTALVRESSGSDSSGSVYVLKNRYMDYMGLGTTKTGPTKQDYLRMKEVLESYAAGLNDGGFKARQYLQIIESPTPERFA